MLNPMVQSDLVTYMGGTIVILFLQATNIILSYFSVFFKLETYFSHLEAKNYTRNAEKSCMMQLVPSFV